MLLETLDASMLGKMITGRGIMRAVKFFVRAARGYDNIDQMDKNV